MAEIRTTGTVISADRDGNKFRGEWLVDGWECSVEVDSHGSMFMHCWHAATGDEAIRKWDPAPVSRRTETTEG